MFEKNCGSFQKQLGALETVSGKFCNFYPHVTLEIVFPALKLAKICCINMDISFSENWQFNLKLAHLSYSRTMPEWLSSQSYKYKSKGNSKIPIFELFSKLREIWEYSLN